MLIIDYFVNQFLSMNCFSSSYGVSGEDRLRLLNYFSLRVVNYFIKLLQCGCGFEVVDTHHCRCDYRPNIDRVSVVIT